MPYQLSHDVWLAHQVSRVRGTLLQNMDPYREYTTAELLTLCANLGLGYSLSEYQEIGLALVAEGFLEQTP